MMNLGMNMRRRTEPESDWVQDEEEPKDEYEERNEIQRVIGHSVMVEFS